MNQSKLFIGGDLSGIQKFLYNITSKKASVSLRGRSQYLTEYMKKIYDGFAEKLSGFENVYCSGGKFYLKAEDTEENKKIVENVAKQKKSELWKEHFGQLSINIAYVQYVEDIERKTIDGLSGKEGMGKLFREINNRFAKQKNQKFKDYIVGNYGDFFEVRPVSEKTRICAITGIESEECVSLDDDIWILPSVKAQILEGEKLRREENFKTFEEYADKTYLGILRMDVDGLGARFAEGFDWWDDYMDFSERLQNYFENEIKNRLDRVYVGLIYAGGDDVFAVGRWDKVIDFAYEIHKDVEDKFGKEGVHISGGIAIVNDKFPISKSAELAGEAEAASKKYPGKNAFTMFNETISWNDYDEIKEYKDEFVYHIEKNNMSKSVLHKIMEYYMLVKKNEMKSEKNYSYLWHSAYFFTRYIGNCSNEQVKDFCKKIRDEKLSERKNYKPLAIAARWAEQLIRK